MRRTSRILAISNLLVAAVALAQDRTPLPIDALAETVWIEEFDVSPNGERIVFKSARAGTYDLWTVPTAGGEPTQLTSMPGREMAPRFSPDGRARRTRAERGEGSLESGQGKGTLHADS